MHARSVALASRASCPSTVRWWKASAHLARQLRSLRPVATSEVAGLGWSSFSVCMAVFSLVGGSHSVLVCIDQGGYAATVDGPERAVDGPERAVRRRAGSAA